MQTLGLVSISFRQHTPTDIVHAMRAAGLSAVEWGSDVHAPCNDTAALDAIAALQREYGITCSSYGTYFRMGTHKPENIRPYIAAAKRLGTDILRIWCGCNHPEKCAQCGKHNLLAEATELARIAEEQNVTLCLECHPDTYTEECDCTVALLRAVGSPHLCMYWQPNQYRTLRQNIDYARTVAPYVRAIHVFHWRGAERLPLSAGTADWREYLSAIEQPVPLLLEFMPDDDIRSLPTEAEALRTIVKGECV